MTPAPRSSTWLVTLLAGLALAGCTDTGSLSIAITDAPFPATEDCLEAALIRVDRVQAKLGDGFVDVGLIDPDPDGTVTFDLLQLRAGLLDGLAFGLLPTGAISEIRLHVVESILQFSDGSPAVDFKVPSGASSGLKLKIDPPALVVAGQSTELVIDVQLGNSFHTTGLGGDPTCDELKLGENKVIFKPVVKIINLSTDGIVLGRVVDTGDAGAGDIEVCAYVADTDIVAEPEPAATTFSAPAGLDDLAEGDYALLVPAGAYDLYVRAQGVEAKSLAREDVPVVAGQRTEGQDLALP